MKQKIRMAMESWPRRKPWVKERLGGCQLVLNMLRGDVRGALG
jgi:hypothetical protein